MFTKQLGESVTRTKLSKGFVPLLLILFIAIGIVNPAQAQPGHASQPVHTSTTPTSKTSDITVTEPIPYTDETQDDSSLPKGQAKIVQTGVNGSKQITYAVTTVNGKETSRVKKSETTTVQPITQITAVGTYVAPTPAPAQNCPNGTYVNSAGSTVCSPYSSHMAPAGATAQCNDGTYSFSQSRRGTCSHHGGVAIWL